MPDLIVSPATERDIHDLFARPTHALLLVGPSGSGKASLARHIAASLLAKTTDELVQYPYISYVTSTDGKAIPIDAIRDLQQTMTLKIPKVSEQSVNRVAIIEDAHLLTTEAQNALLKTLEEPPEQTVIILTAVGAESLLPTILSRVRRVRLTLPAEAALSDYFMSQGHAKAEVEQVLLLSGGLPGLMQSLLTNPTDHPLYGATEQARTLLRASAYERLTVVDALSKQRSLCIDMLFILGQMAHMALQKADNSTPQVRRRWLAILKQSYLAQDRLKGNVQTKLVLADLMLNI